MAAAMSGVPASNLWGSSLNVVWRRRTELIISPPDRKGVGSSSSLEGRPLIVETPKAGRKVFTGKTHMPTPTKALHFTNVNLFNNAKHCYEMFKNVNPNIEMIISQDIVMTASVQYADFGLPANSWVEFEDLEVTASCSNPFLQIWKGGIKPVFDSKDDLWILANIAKAVGDEIGDKRFHDYFKFEHEGKRAIYLQRLLDSCTTTKGFTVSDIMAGKYGPPGGALLNFRTYPRIPFYEQVHDDEPFHTDTGRLHAYADVPEAIEYGENFIVHREGPEATPSCTQRGVRLHRRPPRAAERRGDRSAW